MLFRLGFAAMAWSIILNQLYHWALGHLFLIGLGLMSIDLLIFGVRPQIKTPLIHGRDRRGKTKHPNQVY